jgi:hypothetical protein
MNDAQAKCFFSVAGIATAAAETDLEQLRQLHATNPGPDYYRETLAATIAFIERLREIDRQFGFQREPLKRQSEALEAAAVSRKAGPLQ